MGNSLSNDEANKIAASAEISPKRVKELHKKWMEAAGKKKKVAFVVSCTRLRGAAMRCNEEELSTIARLPFSSFSLFPRFLPLLALRFALRRVRCFRCHRLFHCTPAVFELSPSSFFFFFCYFFSTNAEQTLNKSEFTAWCLDQNIVQDKVTGERIFEQLDADKNGELEFQEFVRVEVLNKQNKTLDGYVDTIFALYDTNGDGTISRQEIVDFCRRTALGRGVPPQKAEEASQKAADMFLKECDANSDGTLSRAEVLAALKAKPNLKGLF